MCNLHLRSFARRHKEIAAAGIRELVVFHSSTEALEPHARDLPFALIPDPEKWLYREFGVEMGLRSLLNPPAWIPIIRAVTAGILGFLRREATLPALWPEGGRVGLPADFLIGSDGTLLALKYGEHLYDQWSVDELLQLSQTVASPFRA